MKTINAIACILIGLGPLSVSDAIGSSVTTSEVGINSAGLGLTGNEVFIGQVEPRRPGRPSIDSTFNSTVSPTVSRRRIAPATTGLDEISPHAVEVASVIISTDDADSNSNMETPEGMAQDSFLLSSAYLPPANLTEPAYEAALLSMTNLPREFNREVRAINFSAGEPLESGEILDGNSRLTLGVDWSARKHNVLYVIAGDETGLIVPGLPTDNYNGMTIAHSAIDSGKYRKVATGNAFTAASNPKRALIDLIAPGVDVEVASIQSLGVDTEVSRTGTSFAAPHVTGTVALLQQYAVQQIEATPTNPRFTENSQQHEVMKAVLLNSADKIEDTGDGKRLGMERTVLDQNNNTWLQSEAFLDAEDEDELERNTIVLDDQMGAGHLNAKRALTQFRTGEYESSDSVEVPMIGWDYGMTSNAVDINKYILDEPITAGQYVSMTLAWDRRIQFAFGGAGDANSNGEYDATFDPVDSNNVDSTDAFENFDGAPELSFNRMYLYLMPGGATDTSQAALARLAMLRICSIFSLRSTKPTITKFGCNNLMKTN